MAVRAAIVLAGGKAERFQESRKRWFDKVLVKISEKPLLVHVVENVQGVAHEVVVCVNNEERKRRYHDILVRFGVSNVKLVVDVKIDNLGGPLVAILTGLRNVKASTCFTIPADMPMMRPEIVEYMFSSADDAQVAVPMWPNGRLETLVMVLKRPEALEIAETLCDLGRPRSDDVIRGASKVLFVSTVGEIMKLDPELKSFVNINSPEDLIRLEPRGGQSPLVGNTSLNLGSFALQKLKLLREASEKCRQNRLFEASEIFLEAANQLKDYDSFFWAAVSWENQGKSLLSLAKRPENFVNASDLATSAKKALLKAAHSYGLEAEMYVKCNHSFLAERARSDKLWCESRIK
jgi:molybdopterin-guanine dinucleotide biosynthesis protein A